MPKTMTEWQNAARAEAQQARTLASCLPPRHTGPRKLQHTFYNHNAPGPSPMQPISDGTILMDIDAMQIENIVETKLRQPSAHMQTNTISTTSPVAIPATQPAAQTAASTAMTHILGLNEQDQQTVINNLLLMGMGSFTPSIATPQINVMELRLAPSLDTPSQMNVMQLDIAPGPAISTPMPSPFLADLASLSLTDSSSPPPHPPCSPRHPYSLRISPPPLPIVVEDDNASGGGVKTSALLSALDFTEPVHKSWRQTTPPIPCNMTVPTPTLHESLPSTPPPRLPRSPRRNNRPLFLANAFERPRDPDEVVPWTPP
ncbi:hypothetical protein EDB86DRAFT_3119607 [Lactarius hatsudake]|nr:hypothetical protein EDB86DRAFT_3119607 [Lactarius hatsudake]